MEWNDFVGGLPTEWGALTLMKWLDLRGNRLTGPLPKSWAAMTQIPTKAADVTRIGRGTKTLRPTALVVTVGACATLAITDGVTISAALVTTVGHRH